MATHSSILAWRIPGKGEPGGLPVYGVAQSRTGLKRLSSSKYLLIGEQKKKTQILVYWWSRILEIIDLYNNMDKSQKDCFEWRKYLFIMEKNHNGGCHKVGGFPEKGVWGHFQQMKIFNALILVLETSVYTHFITCWTICPSP